MLRAGVLVELLQELGAALVQLLITLEEELTERLLELIAEALLIPEGIADQLSVPYIDRYFSSTSSWVSRNMGLSKASARPSS